MADQVAVLAGGCFWCTEAVFLDVVGVKSVESGYTGGQTVNPTYKQVCGGDTGHAEAIRITFDGDVLSYGDLLDIFFAIHDPTQLNRQGNDIGTQYRSAIFPQDEAQREEAIAAIGRANEQNDGKVVTTIEPKADANHAVCGAASIVAKTTRDAALDALRSTWGHLGSGYPSDPVTRAWLLSCATSGAPWPTFVRTRWATLERVIADAGITTSG